MARPKMDIVQRKVRCKKDSIMVSNNGLEKHIPAGTILQSLELFENGRKLKMGLSVEIEGTMFHKEIFCNHSRNYSKDIRDHL